MGPETTQSKLHTIPIALVLTASCSLPVTITAASQTGDAGLPAGCSE
jgi:hypothetical protein